jgi:cyclophilin family peptidyl-prolyl cis-trans isomerase
MWFYTKNSEPAFLTTAYVEESLGASSTNVNIEKSTQQATTSVYKIDNKKKIMNATFHTNKGDITIELLNEKAPKTVENFVKLAQSGFYNGVKFHRVIKGFMIQGGDPLTKDDSKADYWGTGGPGYTFNDEISNDNKNDVGTIAMANAGPNTNGSQFFINVNANNFLDTKHTVFGKVIKGMEVVKEIEVVKTVQDRPLEAVVINSISF